MPKRSKKTLREKLAPVIEEQNVDGNIKWVCNVKIDEETPCGYHQERILFPGNFKRHIVLKHPDVVPSLKLDEQAFDDKDDAEPEPKKATPGKLSGKLVVNTTPFGVLLGTVMLVTRNGLPYNFPDWEAMKFTLQPLWDAAKLTVTRNTLPELVKKVAKNLRMIMAAEFKDKIISIKIDAASRNGRSVLGINAQFADEDGKVHVRNIAVHEMVERQTKENLKTVIERELLEFGLVWAQILAITHDNGANMCACVRLINVIIRALAAMILPQGCQVEKDFPESNQQADAELETDAEPDAETEAEAEEEDEVGVSSDGNIKDDYCDEECCDFEADNGTTDYEEDIQIDQVQSVRCGAHTAQLAVWDVLTKYKPRLQLINKICIQMRHKEFRQLFTGYKVPLPPKVVETRWNVWFVLLSYLKSLMETPLYPVLLAQEPTLDLAKHKLFIEQFIDAFEPVYQLTLRLQMDHLPLTDFYSYWLICRGFLHEIANTGNRLAKKLESAMGTRIEKLSKSSLFKAAQYLDPRFNFAGSNRLTGDDKKEAKRYLLDLNHRLDELSGIRATPDSAEDTPVSDAPICTNIEDYVAGLFNEDAPGTSAVKDDSALSVLTKLESRPMIGITRLPWTRKGEQIFTGKRFDIIEYWKKREVANPLCYRLARVIFSAPSTQVTVERLFSHLKFILTEFRNKLSKDSVKDLMLLRMNHVLLPRAVEMLVKQLKE